MNAQPSRGILTVIAATVALTTSFAAHAQTPKVMFVTSVAGDGDLSSWTDSQGQSGLAGADTVCRARAAAGGLSNPQNFVAWMSDTSDDAYCRLLGLSGKKANNCGQAALPTTGGWLRTDGYPFTRNLQSLTQVGAWVPPRIDEFQQPAEGGFGGGFTGTEFDGTLDEGQFDGAGDDYNTCEDWTSDSGTLFGREGYYDAGWFEWTRAAIGICRFARPIYCFETGDGPDLEPPAVQGAVVFYLNQRLDGEQIGSLENADAICQQSAQTSGLPAPDSYLAWLSDGEQDAIDRFSFDGPWIRPDGVLVANSQSDLTDGSLHGQVNVDQDGQYVGKSPSPFGSDFWAWTGSAPDGLGTAVDCEEWTVSFSSVSGDSGRPEFADASWTQDFNIDGPTPAGCQRRRGFYCFSQVATGVGGRLFTDGFESGTTSQWSLTSP